MANYLSGTNDELWRECAAWLTRWEILEDNHKANFPESTIADLASTLRDGVLLCQLLNKIDRGCIDMKNVNLKPTMAQFLCLRNIRLFLEKCKFNFGLRETDLFQDIMLFDLTDFHKVLCTLSKLSLSKKSLKSGKRGFSAQNETTADEDEIYESLMKHQPTEVRHSIIDTYYSQSEDIYQDLLEVRYRIKPKKPKEKRDYVIGELLDTEKNYVDVLSKLKGNFMIPLQVYMDDDDYDCVFYKIKELYRIHSTLVTELGKIRTQPNTKISNIFLKFKDKFLVYGGYCANLTKASNRLRELRDQNEDFNQKIIDLEQDVNNCKFKLKDVLTLPMQRVLKYQLLLAELIKATDKTHNEHRDLTRAREAMLDIADCINEEARDAEHLDVINNLQETIVEWELLEGMGLSNYGKLLKDAELKMKTCEQQKPRNRYIFIFEKCILICKKSKDNQFAYRDMLNLKEHHVLDSHEMYTFFLVKNGNEIVYTVSVRSVELKKRIIESIKEAIGDVRPKIAPQTNHDFNLETFDNPMQCGYCSKYLKGLISQGYFCSKCNTYAHKDCLRCIGVCEVLPPRPPRAPYLDPLWYVGEMDGITAKEKLLRRKKGTFLVRKSVGKDSYSLDLRTYDAVKHMRINTISDETGHSKKFYLSESKYFSSIKELVLNYTTNSLTENFARVDEKLVYPFNQ